MPKIQDKSKEQKDAEAEVQGFKNELGPFVVAAETTRMAMVFTDATQLGNPIIFANDSFLSLTGYAREEVLGQSFNFLMVHAADAETLAKIEAEFQGESDGGAEIVTAARTAASSGPLFSSARFGRRAAILFNILLRSLTSPHSRRSKLIQGSSSTS